MSELKPGDGEIYPPEAEDGAGAAARAYWRENLTLMGILLAIWFVVSFGAGILFRDWLDQFSIGGADHILAEPVLVLDGQLFALAVELQSPLRRFTRQLAGEAIAAVEVKWVGGMHGVDPAERKRRAYSILPLLVRAD